MTTEKHAVRYIYYRGETKTSTRHKGIIAAGYKYNPDVNRLMITFAFCSPKDRFCKRTARNIIDGRFESHAIINLDNCGQPLEEPKYGDVARYIRDWYNKIEMDSDGIDYNNIYLVESLVVRKRIPHWAKQIV